MNTQLAEKLDRIIERFDLIQAELSSGATGESFVRLSREYAEIEPTARVAQGLRKAYSDRQSVAALAAESDPEIV